MIEKEQRLLISILNLIAQRFDKHAVLRGGMVLRLLGCARLTNDLDYVFVPFKSKKEIVDDVLATVRQIPGARVSHSMNSKCLRVIVTVDDISVQVEAKTALEVPTEVISTREVARDFGVPPRLVSVVSHPVALANKMAAWNERRLMRDLYDIWFFLRMGVRPDRPTLESRLQKPEYSRLVSEQDQLSPDCGVEEFFGFLRESSATLTDPQIADTLSDYLPVGEIAGLAMAFRAELAKLR